MSEAFIVSARKYRPQRFDEVVGQEVTTQTLKNAIKNNHLAHSFLFCGSRGVGKTTIARILAKTINCKNLQADGEACNECDSCTSFNNNASFNIHELDAASKNSVDDIRGLVEQVMYPPQNAQYKIFIIDEVHMLSQSAFNAFLKTLEEPPAYAKFILATTEKHKILPTILSRCQIYDFKRIKVSDIKNHLKKIAEKEGIEADENALQLIALKADGGLRDALSLFDRLVSMHEKKLSYQDVLSNLNILDYDYYFQILDAIQAESSDQILLMLDNIMSKGFDVDVFLSGLSEHIRNLWMSKKETTHSLIEFADDVKQRFIKQGEVISESILLNLLQIISDCEVSLKSSRNRRLQVELTLLKMCYVKRLLHSSWTEMDEKKKLTNTAPTVTVQSPLVNSTAETIEPSSNSIKRGLVIEDLLNKVQSQKIDEEVTSQNNFSRDNELKELQLWNVLVQKFEGDKASKELLLSIHPTIIGSKFEVTVSNSIQAGLVNTLFSSLSKLAKTVSNTPIEFECKIDNSLIQKEDPTKREKFEELMTKYPILSQIKDDFRLDFNY
jgi:DNA polymerase-3 subunit gamma/tau